MTHEERAGLMRIDATLALATGIDCRWRLHKYDTKTGALMGGLKQHKTHAECLEDCANDKRLTDLRVKKGGENTATDPVPVPADWWPTRDIAHAWRVVDWLRERGWWLNLHSPDPPTLPNPGRQWWAAFFHQKHTCREATADTPALAIVTAALMITLAADLEAKNIVLPKLDPAIGEGA